MKMEKAFQKVGSGMNAFAALIFLSFPALAQDHYQAPEQIADLHHLGCDSVGRGYCESTTYPVESEIGALIQFSRDFVFYNHLQLKVDLNWNASLQMAHQLIASEKYRAAADHFVDQVNQLRADDKIKSIMSMKPDVYCTDVQVCNYAYLFIYLKDGRLLFYEFNPQPLGE